MRQVSHYIELTTLNPQNLAWHPRDMSSYATLCSVAGYRTSPWLCSHQQTPMRP
jgi:hypothetical protein